MSYHVPVLLMASVDGLNVKPGGVYVDLTYGSGGHSGEILGRLGNDGRLFVFDQDDDAKQNIINDSRLTFLDVNFRFFRNYLMSLGVEKVDGILADLGVSSHQFDKAERGFSFRFDSELDMRMDKGNSFNAKVLLNTYGEDELRRIFFLYGEIPFASKLAWAVVKHREKADFEKISDLTDAIGRWIPKNAENKFLAKVFQAIRIEVNEEIDVLSEMLLQTTEMLRPGGRLSIISYHSLEDRLVKNFMKSGNLEGKVEKDFHGNLICPFSPVSKKAIIPVEDEISANPRARSAKLRIVEKL